MVRLEGQNNKALFPLSLETATLDRVPRLSTRPSSKSSLKGGIIPVAESAQLEESSPLSSPAFPSCLSPAHRAPTQAPSTPCLEEPWPHLPCSSIQLLFKAVGVIALAEGVPHLPACQEP